MSKKNGKGTSQAKANPQALVVVSKKKTTTPKAASVKAAMAPAKAQTSGPVVTTGPRKGQWQRSDQLRAAPAVTKRQMEHEAIVVRTPDLQGPLGQNRGFERLAAVSADYVRAVADPTDAPLCGIPTEWPLTPSYKYRAYSQDTVDIGSASFGFIQASPVRGMSNDLSAVMYSSGAYASSGAFPTTYAEAGVVARQSNAPYPTASFGNGPDKLQGRCVGCMVRCWPIMPELDLGGEVVAARQPDNESMTGGYTKAQLLATPGRVRQPVESNREKCAIEVYHLPTKAQDVEYIVPSTSFGYTMSIALSGKAATQFGWEFFAIYEVIGNNAPSTTMTYGDPAGLTAAIESASETGSTFAGSAKSFVKTLLKTASQELFTMSNGPNVGVLEQAKLIAMNSLSKYAQDMITWRGAKIALGIPDVPAMIDATESKVSAMTDSEDYKVVSYSDMMASVTNGEYTFQRKEPWFELRDRDGVDYLALPLHCGKTISHPDNNPRYAFRGSPKLAYRSKEWYGSSKDGGLMRVYRLKKDVNEFKSSKPSKGYS